MPRLNENLPPYGPSKGTIAGLLLLSRLSPTRVDEELLRQHAIAPRNEYKVLGALRFLGLIDQQGEPTPQARLLKARGSLYTLNLQGIVREAYRALFQHLQAHEASTESIYNHFVTERGLGAEMATKATRFFLDLCRLAELSIGTRGRPSRLPTPSSRGLPPSRRRARRPAPHLEAEHLSVSHLPLVLALTPEMARLEEEELVVLLRRLRRAWQRAGAE